MDPLTVFPPEIIHKIWLSLEPADLLSARAVASHWLASINDCPGAWVTDFSHDWTEFLTVKRAVRGWSSKAVRTQTITNVRDSVFTEFAYYLLYRNGTLEMFTPNGCSFLTYHRPVTDLHRGEKCLLIGVDDVNTQDTPEPRHRTIVTDFVFNSMDDIPDVTIIASSPNGYCYEQNGGYFFSLGPDIPGALKIPYALDAQLYFLTSCAVSVQGFTVKTAQFFDVRTKSFAPLKTSVSTPRWIPSVNVVLGPEDYFVIIVEQRDFNTFSVYHRNIALFEGNCPFSFECVFTTDYFVTFLNDVATAFKLKDFTKYYLLELPGHRHIKSINCESWSLLCNTFAVSGLPFESLSCCVYRLSEINCKSATATQPKSPKDEAKLEPKLQLLAVNFTWCSIVKNPDFRIFPGYALKIDR